MRSRAGSPYTGEPKAHPTQKGNELLLTPDKEVFWKTLNVLNYRALQRQSLLGINLKNPKFIDIIILNSCIF